MERDQVDLPNEFRQRLDELGLDFLAEILEVEAGRNPDNVDALAELGHVYTRQGRYAMGLAVDRKLVALVPGNPTVHYNLACSLAILGKAQDAMDTLEHAVGLGYDDPAFMMQDEDLRRLHAEERFQNLVRRLEQQTP